MVRRAFAWFLAWLVVTALFYVVWGLLSLLCLHAWPSPTRLASWHDPALTALIVMLPLEKWTLKWLSWVRGTRASRPAASQGAAPDGETKGERT